MSAHRSLMTGALPPELLRSAPRPVVLNGSGKAVLIVALALLLGGLIGGVALYSAAARDAARNKLQASDNAAAQGEVVELGRTRGEHPRRVVIYKYSVAGSIYQGRAVLRPADRRPFASGMPVAIRYARFQPEVSWMPGYEPRGVPMWTPAILAVSLMSLAGMLMLLIRRERVLLAEGRATVAHVTRVKKQSEHGKGRTYRIEYEFTLLSGATRTGHADTSKQAPAEGSIVPILYDRERPQKSAIYPLSLVRVDMPQS